MHFIRSATAVVSLLTGSALANASAQNSIPSWAATFLQSWYLVYNGSDAVRLAALFALDARLGTTLAVARSKQTMPRPLPRISTRAAAATTGCGSLVP